MPDLSSLITWHRKSNQINTTGAISGAGTAYPSRAPEFIPCFSGFVLLDLQFYVYVLQNVVCHFVLFLLAIVLSVLRQFTDSDYPFDIFILFHGIEKSAIYCLHLVSNPPELYQWCNHAHLQCGRSWLTEYEQC